MLDELIRKNRSYRRFKESVIVEKDTLRALINFARLSASARNMQPLKFFISNDEYTNNNIFPNTSWGGYLGPEEGRPVWGERPSAYIIILGDTNIADNFYCDHGIAAQSILLGAVEKGLGGCILGSLKKEELQKILSIPKQYEILLVLAIGKPIELVVIDPINEERGIKYWRDGMKVHHVPKRSLDDLVIEKF